MPDYAYYRTRLRGLPFPHAVVDMALLRENIRTNLRRAAHLPIRIATKSVRCVEILRYIQRSDVRFRGLMAYHGREVLHLLAEGFDDILLGYPSVQPKLLQQIAERSVDKQLYFMVDSPAHLELIEAAGRAVGRPLSVCVDIDVSDDYPGLHFGVWRSSLRSLVDLERFLNHLNTLSHVHLAGLMGYEAQVAGVGDRVPGGILKNKIVAWLQRRAVRRAAARRCDAVRMCKDFGYALTFVNGGGTGSLESTVRDPSVTEVTVGSGFYASHLFDYYRNFDLQPTLFYGIPVVRHPRPRLYTCHGGGYIASGATEATKAPVVHLPPGGRLDKLEGAGEVQTPVWFREDPGLQLGDPIYLRPAKAGEVLDHFAEVHLLEADALRKAATYRNA